jgi:CRP-like cAMP-binding protein
MISNSAFSNYLNKFIHFKEGEYNEYMAPYIKTRKFHKKEIITKSGEVENYFNIIEKGLVRKYYKKGKHEINTQISVEGHIIHSQESFHSRLPSEYIVEAIEPSVLSAISFDDLEKVYASSKRMEKLGRLVITASMVLKDRWQSQLVMLTPRERFIKFVTQQSGLMQRVPQKYLASYLNIKPETFSRFKHLLKDHSKIKLLQEN